MTTTGRFSRIAARVLARELAQDEGRPSADERARAIAALEDALRARARRRTRTMWVGGLAAAAAMLLVAGAGYEWMAGGGGASQVARAPGAPVVVLAEATGTGAVVIPAGAQVGEPLARGRALARGSRVVAGRWGRAVLSISTGTRLVVEEGGALSVVDAGSMQHFALGAGAVRADVAHLEPGERFIISTDDADVEVHGTSFRVSLVAPDARCGDGTTTRVEVFAGVVTVRHASVTSQVRPGQVWPARCSAGSSAARPMDGDAARATTPARHVAGHEAQVVVGSGGRPMQGVATAPGEIEPPVGQDTPGVPRARTEQAPAPRSAPSSMLAAQNDAFAEAVALRRSGQVRLAIAAFAQFLEDYPTSPLVESAAIEHMRLLRDVDATRAASAARRYLARYPDGFARDEAEQILSLP